MMRRGPMLMKTNFMTGSVYITVAVDGIFAGEHALRDALADDDDGFAAACDLRY